MKKWRAENRDKVLLQKREWRLKNLDKARASVRKCHQEKFYRSILSCRRCDEEKPRGQGTVYCEPCRITVKEQRAARRTNPEYYIRNSKRIRKHRAEYYQENKDQFYEKTKKWRLANLERSREFSNNWRKRNPDIATANSNRYRARKLNAMPHWLTDEQHGFIQDYYEVAQLLNLEVDHIVPLKGTTVCGLHVPWNLQLLTKFENCSKGNKLLAQGELQRSR